MCGIVSWDISLGFFDIYCKDRSTVANEKPFLVLEFLVNSTPPFFHRNSAHFSQLTLKARALNNTNGLYLDNFVSFPIGGQIRHNFSTIGILSSCWLENRELPIGSKAASPVLIRHQISNLSTFVTVQMHSKWLKVVVSKIRCQFYKFLIKVWGKSEKFKDHPLI